MSRKIKLWKDPYDCGVDLYKKKTVTINSGVTVLVGCNGIGKTTFLHQVKNRLKKQNIPCIEYDNLNDGGSNSVAEAGFNEDFTFIATAISSSEGENIIMNINKLASDLGDFVRTGKVKEKNPFVETLKTLNDVKGENKVAVSERWILLDAVDSGLSVDNIVDIKEYLFKTILEHNYENEIYIVISANEYEMARGEKCFDVYNGKYIMFKDYEEYRNMILESKKWKDERYMDNRL